MAGTLGKRRAWDSRRIIDAATLDLLQLAVVSAGHAKVDTHRICQLKVEPYLEEC